MAGVAAWLAGCFTEAGNAEDEFQVQALFRVEYSVPPVSESAPQFDSVRLKQFILTFTETEYYTGIDESHPLWVDSDGISVDFTGKDSVPLPPLKETNHGWSQLEMELAIQPPLPLRLDTVDFDAFQDPGYIKGVAYNGGVACNFLFALPAATNLELYYTGDLLRSWLVGRDCRLKFIFYPEKWISNALVQQADASQDEQGAPLRVFDPWHNQALYQALSKQFFNSFNASRVEVN